MSLGQTHGRLQIPESLQAQLGDFRRRVRAIKMAEAACAAATVVALAFLALFALDRAIDTASWPRAALFVAGLVGLAALPLAAYRWVWGSRTLDQLARLLSRTQPRVGDQLLGVIELAHSDSEQARSLRLCEAAIGQVAEDARHRDFRAAVPNPRHKTWAMVAAVPLAIAAALFAVVPSAATNAWARLVAPWASTPRYTFAAVAPLPALLVVPHGEPFTLAARLADGTASRPASGTARLDDQGPVTVALRDGRYEFALPAQIAPGWLAVRIGDARHRIRIEPTLRPELTAVAAAVALPGYLGHAAPLRKDVRGGAVALVKGSRATIAATASRELADAHVDGAPRTPQGATVSSPETPIDASRTMEFRWRDALGLAGKAPFTLAITGRDDEAPTLSCEDLPRQKVVLDSEQLAFQVKAQDDFGVRRVGIEWQGAEDPTVKTPARGEKVLAAGGFEKETLDVRGTFTAKSLGIEPQAIALRMFAEDYFPGRARVYSPTYTLYVLDPEQHAIWLTEQLSKWHRQALEVRDRELQLHETNRQIRAMTGEELDRPETRKKVEAQATDERANGRRLSNLVGSGEDLVKQATRNPEFGVGHLEKWAEMLQVLKDISANRMPSVADLLKQAAQAPIAAAPAPGRKTPMAGQVRAAGGSGPPSETRPSKAPLPVVPQVVDRESQQQPPDKGAAAPGGKKNPSAPSLRLPQTTLAGKAGPPKPPTDAPAAVDQAVREQRDLLAEFEKVAEELNRVLANLEGSTLVKRLKAASRAQGKIAGRINDYLGDTFGVNAPEVGPVAAKVLDEMAVQEGKGSETLSLIMDDMDSYFERRRTAKFKAVLDDMRKHDVVGGLRQLGDDLKRENGTSIAQCEFWSDSLDRWAEDLVDPANGGACPGGKSPGSLPPSIVLEVLQILEGEVNLREETRVAQQARPALKVEDHALQAGKLSETQETLRDRVEKVIVRIRALRDAEREFAYEIKLLGQVEDVMRDAVAILAKPETGRPAIAAETEAIELLLKSRRINPKGGGGSGGASPGAGGGGTTTDSALALLGRGTNEKEVREDRGVSQATGESGPSLPEEFRAGLDEYFNKLEGRPAGQ